MSNILRFPDVKKYTDGEMAMFVYAKAMDGMFVFGYGLGIRRGILIGSLASMIVLYGIIILFSVVV